MLLSPNVCSHLRHCQCQYASARWRLHCLAAPGCAVKERYAAGARLLHCRCSRVATSLQSTPLPPRGSAVALLCLATENKSKGNTGQPARISKCCTVQVSMHAYIIDEQENLLQTVQYTQVSQCAAMSTYQAPSSLPAAYKVAYCRG